MIIIRTNLDMFAPFLTNKGKDLRLTFSAPANDENDIV